MSSHQNWLTSWTHFSCTLQWLLLANKAGGWLCPFKETLKYECMNKHDRMISPDSLDPEASQKTLQLCLLRTYLIVINH